MSTHTFSAMAGTENNINPTNNQSINLFSGTKNISERAIAQQFCIVANDLRAILASINETATIQKEILISIQNLNSKMNDMNNKFDESSKSTDCMTHCVETVADKLEEMVNTLSNVGNQISSTFDANVEKYITVSTELVNTINNKI